MTLLKAFKTEISPSKNQANKINRTIGTCRFVYNFYIDHNKEVYESTKRFVSGMEFSKWVNNDFIPNHPNYSWIKKVGSKAVKQSIMNGEKAFKKFFKGEAGFPNFKKKNDQDVKAYFPKNNKTDWVVDRHRIKVPTFGWVKLKEFGYIPVGATITGGTISQKADRYYVSVTVDMPEVKQHHVALKDGVGVDVGVKDFAISSHGTVFKNLNKSSAIRKTEKKLRREQRALSRKIEMKKRGENPATECGRNIAKNVLRVQKIHQRLTNLRKEYRAYVVSVLAKTKPAYITVEDLNVKGMMKNRHLSRAIANQGFYDFKLKLLNACRKAGIELRQVSRFYPSSKLCSNCGHKKTVLSLSERIYRCESCGMELDRDLNAAINLKQAKAYVVLT
jgi:putative transposase